MSQYGARPENAGTYWVDLRIMLKKIRLLCGYSHADVANALGISRSTYTYYENGRTAPDLVTLVALAQVYEIPPECFLYLITTHRYMLTMDSDKIDQFDVVIVDEDIIYKSVISNQAEVPKSFLEKLRFRIIDESQLAKKIDALFRESRLTSCIELEEIDCEKLNIEDSLKEGMDIPAFCKAKHFIYRKASEDATIKKDTITFLKPATFQDAKYIVVSATASKEVYERYFGKDRVEFIECPKAKYMGKLYQYPARSMSRKYEREHPGSIQKIVDLFDIPESNVITYMNQGMGDLHFGNTEGSNSMEGEDILVIGTPNQVTFMYKLVALMLGVEFDEDEEMSPQIVEYNGYRFSIMIFENEDLRAIHFWMLESELEQAVGRARLLRNSCEVHLFSNFPVSKLSWSMISISRTTNLKRNDVLLQANQLYA